MEATHDAKMSPGDILYLARHVFLPPELPGGDDFDPAHERQLSNAVLCSLVRFWKHVSTEQHGAVDAATAMMRHFTSVHEASGNSLFATNEDKLKLAIADLGMNGGSIPLHIHAQNAGVLITKADDHVDVEVFELSPLNRHVVGTKGRLRRSFPASGVAIPNSTFGDPEFQATLAFTLAKMSQQRASGTRPQARKAGKMHDEDRETTNPTMITELLVAYLMALGSPANTSKIWKNTREEVLFDRSLLPWRRSPTWLLVRVALQLSFSRSTTTLQSTGDLYKEFMVCLMADILDQSHDHSLNSDLFLAMSAKIHRRVQKLDSITTPIRTHAYAVMEQTNALLKKTLALIQERDWTRLGLSTLKQLDFKQDTLADLPELDQYIDSIGKRSRDSSHVHFNPSWTLVKYPSDSLPTLSGSTPDCMAFNLFAVERWVATHLDHWLAKQISETDTCGQLRSLIETYHSNMMSVFSQNPEFMSVMLLTILELWIACDKAAIHACLLLQEYDPGIPHVLLQSLVLPFKQQMERLHKIEVYLRGRADRSTYSAPHILTAFGTSECFAVRWFQQSASHQALFKRIDSWATNNRKAKREELVKKRAQYQFLMDEHSQSTCEYSDSYDRYEARYETRHSLCCQKCQYIEEASSIQISIHEWPLPSRSLEAQSVVFELHVPPPFGHWRDTTLFLLSNVLGSSYESVEAPRDRYTPRSYSGFSDFFVSFSSNQRGIILSENKPHIVTHRQMKYVATASEEDVCLDNALHYQQYDAENDCFTRRFRVSDRVEKLCTYMMPPRSSSLQPFLSRPVKGAKALSPNHVISTQSDCPDHMSLGEYKALCSVPVGNRVQWMNILVQLHAPSVDFKKIETLFTFLRCIFQAGPSGNQGVLREAHAVVEDARFASVLLNGVQKALGHLKGNWQAAQAVSAFISDVVMAWIDALKDKTNQTTKDAERNELRSKAVVVALICFGSFDVNDSVLEDILSSPKHASVFLRCSIIIQEGKQSINLQDTFHALLHHRWQRLSYRSYGILVRQIVENSNGALDDALRLSWPAYKTKTKWQRVSKVYDYWLTTDAANPGTDDTLKVHFNLLDGQLLVNGDPLSCLPSEYERHPMYSMLFGKSIIEVMPSAVPGLRFSGKSTYQGYTLYFGMANSGGTVAQSDLLLRAEKDGCWYELVPPRLLRGLFPVAFVEECVHWYNVNNEHVEFRLEESPWSHALEGWTLAKAGAGGQWQLRNSFQSLLSVRSATARRISTALHSLEDHLRIHCVFNEASSSLEIELPRIQLAFCLEPGSDRIRSRQYRGMFVDDDQSLPTLLGLCSRLVLKGEEAPHRRSLLIPNGEISHQRSKEHVCVWTDKDTATKVYSYRVDNMLGRLVDGSSSLEGKLLLCYMHALTSFCLPDPLTQRTGTEEALMILSSAAVRSFERLSLEAVEMLRTIARLSPNRECYPANERVMQVVDWSSKLDFLAQHGGYYIAVSGLLNQHNNSMLFYPESWTEEPLKPAMDIDLLDRDNIRSSTFRVWGFGAESFTTEHDVVYEGRDRWRNSDRVDRAFGISSFIFHTPSNPHCYISSDLSSHIWAYLERCRGTFEMLGQGHLVASKLAFDAGLLTDSDEFISQYWPDIHHILSGDRTRLNRHSIMIWLATLSFAKKPDMSILYTIASFFTMQQMTQIRPPSANSFSLWEGNRPKKDQISALIKAKSRILSESPEAQLVQDSSKAQGPFERRRQQAFIASKEKSLAKLTEAIMAQWPCQMLKLPVDVNSVGWASYFKMDNVIVAARSEFTRWYDNYQFLEYLCEIQHHVIRKVVPVHMASPSLAMKNWHFCRKPGFFMFDNIFACDAPAMQRIEETDLGWILHPYSHGENDSYCLTGLITALEAKAGSDYERNYVKRLRHSLASLQIRNKDFEVQQTGARLIETLKAFKSSVLEPQNQAIVQHWPRLSPIFFLQQLSHRRWRGLHDKWKDYLVYYGLALSRLQQAERILESFHSRTKLIQELQNPGHRNWKPRDQPESLLLEIESGITIREVQEQIAARMRTSSSGLNQVMQLNMGEGKSSVIVPMVAAALADGKRLVRVIVAKPQAKQMFGMLVSKLGGLLDRPVFTMPFSRAINIGKTEAETIHKMYQNCMASGGILLVQPEHILSFKLMAIERVIVGEESTGRLLLTSQEMLHQSTRDIVDESDENFSVKFELVYTMGTQRPTGHSPDRWICIQDVLEAFRTCVREVKQKLPESIEVYPGPHGCFPRTRILREDAREALLAQIATHICHKGLSGFPIARQPESIQQAVFHYMTKPHLTAGEIDLVEGQDEIWNNETADTLLLLRGLIAGGVLAFAFGNKRWRVDFGFDPRRRPATRLAVPYRAKDNPSTRSGFSHPDVVITLTSLSYYYGGLSDDDLFLMLNNLIESDQAEIEYQALVRDANELPLAFRQLAGVNLEDRYQCTTQIFPCLRYGKSIIDYFLANQVFPKEMKEFPQKLSASGWDLGEQKNYPTTGFSGTNDSRIVLPLDVDQLDLEDQIHTNALVLEYLLQSENSVALMDGNQRADTSDAERLLAMVIGMEPPVRVILDVGAQILELNNIQVAQQWLKMLPDNEKTQAVVFFDDNDHLCVLDRKERVEPLHISPFATQLDVCLVFLDEVHTRGTDLRLPEDYRAAVTLGANLTKDRLVQACMRMRRLGKGQSVVFCVPEEIRVKMQTWSARDRMSELGVADILEWAISETWLDAVRSIPLWAIQGKRHRVHEKLWAAARTTDGGIDMSKDHANRFLEDEAQSLDARYRPQSEASSHLTRDLVDLERDDPIVQQLRDFDHLNALPAALHEEQERELSPEIEGERQIERPRPAEPLPHHIHPDMERFVSAGVLSADSPACMPAFKALSTTSAAEYLDMEKFPGSLLVSVDFAHCIKVGNGLLDCYHRSVQWVLTSPRQSPTGLIDHMVIISPYEAQQLLPRIKTSRYVALHLYAPRPNLEYRALDTLDLYTVPEQPHSRIPVPLIIELNLFAGQLYFSSFAEYINVCNFLGVDTRKAREGEGDLVEDLTMSTTDDANGRHFEESPVKFLKVLLSKIRRDCVGIDKSHMGRVLEHRLLSLADFESS